MLHLQTLLDNPVILTTKSLSWEFANIEGLRLYPVETLIDDRSSLDNPGHMIPGDLKDSEDDAVLVLTSGSTAKVKAVALTHGQIIASLQGKESHHKTHSGDVFLNWIGMDHVASLVEIHLHASKLLIRGTHSTMLWLIIEVSLHSDQIHVLTSELPRDPLLFIQLLHTHQVAYTFAPNFFLTRLRDALASSPNFTADLSSLRKLISGGEANVSVTCEALTRQLQRYGVRGEVITPGFGMTETCAGSIYAEASPCSESTPALDLEFTSVGMCVPGIKMRVVRLPRKSQLAACGEIGELQLKGPVVFKRYFNDPYATAQAFTDDGWFVTGDLAWLDNSGCLNLAGRSKDTIIVNGVNWNSTEIETAIEDEAIQGVLQSFTVAFPCRDPGSATESIAIVYCLDHASDDAARFETHKAVGKTVALLTGHTPDRIIPLPMEMLEKSSLGKISRTQVRTAYQAGDYKALENHHMDAIRRYQQVQWQQPETDTEYTVQRILSGLITVPAEEISTDLSIFELGIGSFDLIHFKTTIQETLRPPVDIPMSVIMAE